MDMDSPTLTAFAQSTSSFAQDKHPTLTILWHPDLDRIGERFHLVDLPKSRRVSISRSSPPFSAPGVASSAPLADPFVSRQPVLEIEVGPTAVTLFPSATDLPISLGASPLIAPTTVSSADLAKGVVITLGRRIALCLHLASRVDNATDNLGLLGNSDAICSVRSAILSVANLSTPVLIRGETGTGKELTVNAIVQYGSRRQKPFLAVNIGALPRELAAAEIFGHEKGAFTGAGQARDGYFHDAEGGTLFLDEIGLATSDVQTALLRVLETGEVRRLGGRTARRVDVRVLAASDSALLDRTVAQAAFSEALYHRLSAFTIHLPPLRTRPEDLGILLLHFLREAMTQTGDLSKLHTPPTAKRPWLSADIFPKLVASTWPGNVRQLRNFASQLAISNRSAAYARVSPELVASIAREPAGPASATRTPPKTDSVSHQALVEAMARHDYQPAKVARALKVSRTTVYDHMRRDPNLGLLSRLSDEEFLRHVADCNGDLEQVAKRLRASYRAVQLRYAQFSAA